MSSFKVLSNHYSEETAFVVSDYPYGFQLRCQKKYWLDVNKKGARLITRTSNPKKPGTWNAIKASTYSIFGVLCQHGDDAGEEAGYVYWTGLSMYDVESKGKEFLETYREGLTTEQIHDLETYIKIFEKRAEKKAAAEGNI